MAPSSFGGFGVDPPQTPPLPPPVVLFDPAIIFSPSGRLAWVTNTGTGRLTRPLDAVYLLMGRRELTFDATQKSNPNWPQLKRDVVAQNLSPISNSVALVPTPPENFWVTIGYQTGLVTVSEVRAKRPELFASTAAATSNSAFNANHY